MLLQKVAMVRGGGPSARRRPGPPFRPGRANHQMNIQPQFPPHRRQDTKRNSEAVVYDQLARNHHPGQALYEYVTSAHADGRDPQGLPAA